MKPYVTRMGGFNRTAGYGPAFVSVSGCSFLNYLNREVFGRGAVFRDEKRYLFGIPTQTNLSRTVGYYFFIIFLYVGNLVETKCRTVTVRGLTCTCRFHF